MDLLLEILKFMVEFSKNNKISFFKFAFYKKNLKKNFQFIYNLKTNKKMIDAILFCILIHVLHTKKISKIKYPNYWKFIMSLFCILEYVLCE